MSKQTDALTVLEEVAVSLKESAEQIEAKTDFDKGRLLGYYEALSTLSSQCSVAGIALGEVGLADFSPEQLFNKDRKAA